MNFRFGVNAFTVALTMTRNGVDLIIGNPDRSHLWTGLGYDPVRLDIIPPGRSEGPCSRCFAVYPGNLFVIVQRMKSPRAVAIA